VVSRLIAFLFTDIEGSTKLWERDPQAMARALGQHDALLRREIEAHRGRVFKTVGDAFCAVFADPRDAVAAASSAQRALAEEAWGDTAPLRVRMAVHLGAAEERDGDYYGPTLNRIARILAAGHGGQVLVSAAAAAAFDLPDGHRLVDLGEFALRDLQLPERLFQLAAPGLPSHFPPVRSLGERPNNLPAELEPLIGREAETESLGRLLLDEDVHLITLTGPGGIGKTRLAIHVATVLLPSFESGVYFVPLAEIRDPDRIAGEIADALGVREAAGEPLLESLKENLRDRRMLLVLDNFEQMLSAAPIVAELLRASSGSKALVTSRAALRLTGEHELDVPPLALPPPGRSEILNDVVGSAAVELFVRRARSVRPSFALDDTNAAAVAQICRRLDGLPLAIELAAARVRTLPAAQLLSRLSQRLQLLTGGARDLPARQQTLRDAIAWSYELLSEGEKEVFSVLSAFAGGFTLAAAGRLCALSEEAAQEAIDALAQASLIRREDTEDNTRFMFLETIHEYARERLERSTTAESVLERHATYFLELAERIEPHLRDAQQVASVNRLEAEHENLRAALRRTIERGEAQAAARLAGALWRFWMLRAHLSEGRMWLERTLTLTERAPVSASRRVKLLTGFGVLVRSQGDLDLAQEKLDEAVRLARNEGDQRALALALMSLGIVALHRGDYRRAHDLHAESLQLWRDQNDPWGESVALTNLALVAHSEGEFDRARALYEESLRISRALGDRFNAAVSLQNLGNAMLILGDDEAARSFVEQAVDLRRELGDPWGLATALHSLGLLALRRGDLAEAQRVFHQSLLAYRERGDKEGLAVSLEGLAAVAGARDEHERSARLFGAAEAFRERIGLPLSPAERPAYEQRVSATRANLGLKRFAAAWRAGRELTIEQAMELAW
jgi:predicted ATPase/class 3 adenylate cyclase